MPDAPDPQPFEPFPVVRTEPVYDSPWCSLRRDVLRLPDGSLQDYHVIGIDDAVVVVPLLESGEVVMIWQHRHPHGRSHWEVPAGRIQTGESPTDAALRELREETGHHSDAVERLGGFYPVNGISDHYCHVYVARGCVRVTEPVLERAERLSVHVARRADVDRRLDEGQLEDGFTALALHMLRARDARPDPDPAPGAARGST